MAPRLNKSALLLALVLILAVLPFVWRKGKGGWRKIKTTVATMRSGCPANPAERKDFGTADYSWSIKTLDGEEISFSQFRGKTIFLNVWATWCGPCVEEMPEIQALYESLRGEEFAFVLLSEEDLDEVKQFVREHDLHAPIYIATGPLPEVFESRGIPATFIVDPQGTIMLRRIGAAGWDSDGCRDFLRSIAKGPGKT